MRMTEDTPRTGPEAILHALQNMDLDTIEKEQRQVVKDKKKTKRPRAIRLLNIISGLRKNELAPADLMINSVPVIPPKFRPFSVTGNTFLPGDANELYKDLVEYKRLYGATEGALGRAAAGEVYSDLNQAVKAAYGYGDSPNPKTRARKVKGFFTAVTGTNPKNSFLQSKMLSKPVDTVGRGVIIPDADMGMDEIGIPEEMGWKQFGNYVQRRLVKGGMSAPGALRHLQDRSPQARKALEMEMAERPVVVTRSPSWHRFNTIGQHARLVDGDAIRINTYISEGQNADFDGDFVHNQVVTAIPSKLFSDLQLLFMDSPQELPNSLDMQSKLQLPHIDPATHKLAVIDLEDFPRGDLRFEKQGTNSYIEFFDAIPGTKVLAYEQSDNSLVWADVGGWSKHTSPPVEIVKLANGRQSFTDNDPRAVYGMNPADGAMGRWTPTKALELGVLVPCAKSLRETVAALPPIGGQLIPGVPVQPLDFDFGWFLGALCGDGWWDKKDSSYCDKRHDMHGLRNIHIADLTEQNSSQIKAFIDARLDPGGTLNYHRRETFKKDDPSRYGDTVKHSYNFKGSEGLADFLTKHLGGSGDAKTAGSANKHVPGFLFQSSEEFRIGFLTGMVDTDGTVNRSADEGGGQNLSVSSTSLRLVRELQALCLTIGVRSTVTWSKETRKGNDCWMLSISLVDAKACDLFGRLVVDYKREAFAEIKVTRANTSLVFDKVPFTHEVEQILRRDTWSPKIYAEERKIPKEERDSDLRERMGAQTTFQLLSQACRGRVISRDNARRLVTSILRRNQEAQNSLQAAVVFLEWVIKDGERPMGREESKMLRAAIRCVSPKQDMEHRYKQGRKIAARLNQPLKDGVMTSRRARGVLSYLLDTAPYAWAWEHPIIQAWQANFIDKTDISWSPVADVQYTGIKETGYDLTVPGYETFMSADGVILSNTMSVHTPSTPEAVKDVREKMMASKMLWSIKDRDTTMANPKMEQILGLSAASSGKSRQFETDDDAAAAIESGSIDLNDDIEIGTPDKPNLKTNGTK